MGIYSFNDYLSANRQVVTTMNIAATNNAGTTGLPTEGRAGSPEGYPRFQTVYDSTSSGRYHDNNALTGFPVISNFTGTGYITGLNAGNTGSYALAWMGLYDYVWSAKVPNTLTTFSWSTFPSASVISRSPSGSGSEFEMWVWSPSVLAGPMTSTVTYTNSSGVSGRTAQYSTTDLTANGKLYKVPLQSGDIGVQSIQSVTNTDTAATGSNIILTLMRPLIPRLPFKPLPFAYVKMGPAETGMPVVYPSTCLFLMIGGVDANTPGINLSVEIASK